MTRRSRFCSDRVLDCFSEYLRGFGWRDERWLGCSGFLWCSDSGMGRSWAEAAMVKSSESISVKWKMDGFCYGDASRVRIDRVGTARSEAFDC